MAVKESDLKENIKSVLNESKDMVGDKSHQEGIFHKLFRGYAPLDLLSNLDFELDPSANERIQAYCELVKIALRKDKSILDYLIKGYGIDHEDIKHRITAKEEYDKILETLTEDEKHFNNTINNPSQNFKTWMEELNISKVDLETPVLNPFQIDQDGYVPPNVLHRMSIIGLFKLKVPKSHGGLGFNQKEYDIVLQALANISGTLLALISAHSTIGSAPLLMYGSEAQKDKYLKEVAKGQYLVAFGLTEPTSGTDAVGKMKCTAKLSSDGKEWVVNGEKIYITNIHRSGLMYMMAKTDLGDGLPIEKMKPTVFIVELPFRITDSMEDINKKREDLLKNGMRMSKPLDLMMIRGSNQSYISFHDFRIPVDNVLGGVADGAKVIFNGLNKGRAGFGASSAEAAKYIFIQSLKHATKREMFKAFGGKQSDLPQVKRYISKMAINASAIRAVSDLTTAFIQKHSENTNIIAECAAIKILATEGSWNTANYAMRLWGGTGTMRGHCGGMEVNFRDAWIGIVVEGVNEAMQQLVTGVGVQAVKDDSDIIGRHITALLKPFLPKKPDKPGKKKKEFKFDLFGSLIPANIKLIGGLLRFETGKLNFSDALWIQWHTKELAFRTAILGLKYGNKMVFKQLELIRMADIAMDLYSLCAVHLKLKSNCIKCNAEKAALNRFIKITREKVKENLKNLVIENPNDIEDMKLADEWIKTVI